MSESTESVNEAGTNEEPELKELGAEDAAQTVREKSRERKRRRYIDEEKGGYYEWTIKRVENPKLVALSQKYIDTSVNKSGADVAMDEDGYRDLRAAVIKAGVVEGPPGYKPLIDHIKQTWDDEMQEDLSDSIEEFSDITEEETIAFR